MDFSNTAFGKHVSDHPVHNPQTNHDADMAALATRLGSTAGWYAAGSFVLGVILGFVLAIALWPL